MPFLIHAISDGVPFDTSDSDFDHPKTRLVRVDLGFDPSALPTLTTHERELLQTIVVAHTEMRNHLDSWTLTKLLSRQYFLKGLFIGLEVIATSPDAKAQLEMWREKIA